MPSTSVALPSRLLLAGTTFSTHLDEGYVLEHQRGRNLNRKVGVRILQLP